MFAKILSFFSRPKKDIFEKMVIESFGGDFPCYRLDEFYKFKKENPHEYNEILKIVEEPSEDRRFEMVDEFNRLRSISSVGNGSYQTLYLSGIEMGVKIFESGKITLNIRRLD